MGGACTCVCAIFACGLRGIPPLSQPSQKLRAFIFWTRRGDASMLDSIWRNGAVSPAFRACAAPPLAFSPLLIFKGTIMSVLVAATVALVTPYLVKGAEGFSEAAGKDAYEAVKALVGRLSAWWADKPAAKAAAEDMKRDPEENASILAGALERGIARDPQFESELRELVEKANPHLEVIQKIEIADGVTGAKIDDFLNGKVVVRQEIGDAKNVVGADIKRMGS